MKKLWAKKEYIGIIVILILFSIISIMSLSSIPLLQGNARVVNYVGIVRGATQKLIKEEIMGWHLAQSNESFEIISDWYLDDDLIEQLDSIVSELITGVGPNNLVVLKDDTYQSNMRRVQAHWTTLKELIMEVRSGVDPSELFESSQEYFVLVNETVFSAEAYCEAQVNRINTILLVVNGAFVLLIVLGLGMYIRGLAVKRRADALGKIAYVDTLTLLDNRASCQRLIDCIKKSPEDKSLAVFMFDMNDLKLTNDFFGHQGGDRIISDFAQALKKAGEDKCFVGRYGGDEFLVVMDPGDEASAIEFLRNVKNQVEQYNEKQVNSLEMIRYAEGYILAHTMEQDIEDMIHEADNRMYANKRMLKGL